MGEDYKIIYEFTLQSSVNEIGALTIEYWESRGFKCQTDSQNRIIGTRGNVWGNLFSYNMAKLICSLIVEFKDQNRIAVELQIKGKFQDITEVNLADFKLEMMLYPKVLQNLPLPEFLESYIAFRKRAAIKWTFSFRMKGRKLTSDFEIKLNNLANGETMPVVEVITP